MKTLLILLAIALSGCTSNTEFGPCVGLNSQDGKDPKLVYRYSAMNIFVAVIFFELIAPPIFVALDQLECPIGRKP